MGRTDREKTGPGSIAEAEPLLRRALAIDERIFGPDHPSTVRDRDRLESLLRDRDRLDEPDAPRPAGSDGVRPESPTGGSGSTGPA